MSNSTKDTLAGCIAYLGVGLLLVGGCIGSLYWLWTVGFFDTPPQPSYLDIYEQSYAECMARETISASQCHDIALRLASPDKRDKS